ncbi:hypothetical protein LOTGIDRAFT_158651 [Lottia gigantea]|uniref:CCHC-type domain-containing protein n=1 Tax=Lottia gigantea TaxID=225164 RepID=V4ANG6_LOTGI|nr:hypothetical protein LOTGIDRAFT_158651 [Lottia gigantea]ESO98702.1 hypothetical protein LOTGIDRAFT_158651 [Lottia gigantea]
MTSAGQAIKMDDEEVMDVINAFAALGVKPKASSKEDLVAWMEAFTESRKPTVQDKPTVTPHKEERDKPLRVLPTPPKLSTFSGDDDLRSIVMSLASSMKELKDEVRSLRKQPATTINAMKSTTSTSQERTTTTEEDEPTCFKCGKKGHLAYGCRTKKPLNSRMSSSRGRR